MTDENKVGFGRPPARSRFKKGKSGNPRGRPKGSRNLNTLIGEELQQPIQLREGGKTKSVRKGEALAKSLVNNSIQGNMRAVTAVLGVTGGLEAGHAAAPVPVPMTDEDYELLGNFLRNIREAPSVEAVIASLREIDK